MRNTIAVAALSAAALQGFERPAPKVELEGVTAVVKLEFGLKQSQAAVWEGRVRVEGGAIRDAWGWHFLDDDRASADGSFRFETREFDARGRKYSRQDRLPSPVLPNGFWIALERGQRLSIESSQGNTTIDLDQLAKLGRTDLYGGNGAATWMPPVRAISRGEATHHDFPSLTIQGDRRFVAWNAFHNEGNLIYMAYGSQGEWKGSKVTDSWGDYYGSAIAADSGGGAVVVWMAYRGGKWELRSRRLDPATGKFAAEVNVAPAPAHQLFPVMATAADGRPWIAWQQQGELGYDIFVARWEGARWSAPVRVSESPANDWNPAIAATRDGTVYVGWDSYDRGDYDIHLRAIGADGRPGALIRVTDAPSYDAHVSLAVDPADKLWLAWEEAEADWGKDNGVITKTGAMLHQTRRIRLARYAGGQLMEPASPMESSTPQWLTEMHEFPKLAIGPNGLPYIFFRHFLHRQPQEEDDLQMKIGDIATSHSPWYDNVRQMWDVWVTGFDGARWLPVRNVPESAGRCYMQMAAGVVAGKLLAVWPVDGRTYEEPRLTSAQVHYMELPLNDKPATEEKLRLKSGAGPRPAAAAPAAPRAQWNNLRLYRGDLHRHTDISNDSIRDGDILDTYRYAIDAAQLDFLAITDHSGHQRRNYYAYDWWRTRQTATMFDSPGRFAAFFGYERTVAYPGGHRNVISTRRDMQPFRISDEEFTGVEAPGDRLFPAMRASGDIAIPHTTATGGGTDFRDNDPVAQPIAEIFQGLRGSYESEETPVKGNGTRYTQGLLWTAWNRGLKLGVIASSDHYSTHQSYANVWAREFTGTAIHAAMKLRHTFASTDTIVIRFSAQSRRQTAAMGEILRAASPPRLTVAVEGATPLERVELIGNGRVLLTRTPGTVADSFTWQGTELPAENAHYYLRVTQRDKQIGWSSPIWVER